MAHTTPAATPPTLVNTFLCEVGYTTYDPSGIVLAEADPYLRRFVVYSDDAARGDLVDTCVEVCTVYNTEGWEFVSTYRVAGNSTTCSAARSTYEAPGEPYNVQGALFLYDDWVIDESLNYSATTTVHCCTGPVCEGNCTGSAVPAISAAARPADAVTCWVAVAVALVLPLARRRRTLWQC
jgi:hypothetical protein